MPLPFIIAGAVMLVGYMAGHKTGNCSSCGTAFRPIKFNKGSCAKCAAATCDNCLVKVPSTEKIASSVLSIPSPLCPKCNPSFDNDLKRYQGAIERAEAIEVFPQTFKGKTGIDANRPTVSVASDWCGTQQTAEHQLKVACAFLGYEIIVDRSYTKQETGGSYVHSEWKAVGNLGYKTVEG